MQSRKLYASETGPADDRALALVCGDAADIKVGLAPTSTYTDDQAARGVGALRSPHTFRRSPENRARRQVPARKVRCIHGTQLQGQALVGVSEEVVRPWTESSVNRSLGRRRARLHLVAIYHHTTYRIYALALGCTSYLFGLVEWLQLGLC